MTADKIQKMLYANGVYTDEINKKALAWLGSGHNEPRIDLMWHWWRSRVIVAKVTKKAQELNIKI